MKVTLITLTFNRLNIYKKTVPHNFANAGDRPDEFIWVDNGSIDGVRDFMSQYGADVTILNKENKGVAKGWNQALSAATGDYVIITDNDVMFPDGWLKSFKQYMFGVPKTRIVSMCFTPDHIEGIRRREQGEDGHENGLHWAHCHPLYHFMIDRKLLHEVGYMREDYGLYGYDDVEWSYRLAAHVEARGEKSIMMLDKFAPAPLEETEEFENTFIMPTGETYKAFKKREASGQSLTGNMAQYKLLMAVNRYNQTKSFPRYNPFAGGEY